MIRSFTSHCSAHNQHCWDLIWEVAEHREVEAYLSQNEMDVQKYIKVLCIL